MRHWTDAGGAGLIGALRDTPGLLGGSVNERGERTLDKFSVRYAAAIVFSNACLSMKHGNRILYPERCRRYRDSDCLTHGAQINAAAKQTECFESARLRQQTDVLRPGTPRT